MPTRTALHALGTAAGVSLNTFTVDAGAPATIHITGANDGVVELQYNNGTAYEPVMKVYYPGITVTGLGTYQTYRPDSPRAFKVDVEK